MAIVIIILLLPLVTGFNINPALIVHLLNSLGCILARRHSRGAHMPHQATNNVRVLPGTGLYAPGWKAAMWIKCLAEGQERQVLTGIELATLWSRVKGSIQYTTVLPNYHYNEERKFAFTFAVGDSIIWASSRQILHHSTQGMGLGVVM